MLNFWIWVSTTACRTFLGLKRFRVTCGLQNISSADAFEPQTRFLKFQKFLIGTGKTLRKLKFDKSFILSKIIVLLYYNKILSNKFKKFAEVIFRRRRVSKESRFRIPMLYFALDLIVT